MIRSIKKSEDDIPVPPLLKSAALWGMPNLLFTFFFLWLLILYLNRPLHCLTIFVMIYLFLQNGVFLEFHLVMNFCLPARCDCLLLVLFAFVLDCALSCMT